MERSIIHYNYGILVQGRQKLVRKPKLKQAAVHYLFSTVVTISGLRRGELAALTWNDVDLEARTMTVNKVMQYDSNGIPSLRHITKTAAGMRTVDIPQRLADYM